MNEKLFFYINEIKNIPPDIRYVDITTIDDYKDNSISNIIINDLLDYYTYNTDKELLSLLCKKIMNGGTIEIQAPDLDELCIASASLKIDQSVVKSVLYNNKKSIHTIYDIEHMLNDFGFTIYEKRYINIFEYYILAKKNEE